MAQGVSPISESLDFEMPPRSPALSSKRVYRDGAVCGSACRRNELDDVVRPMCFPKRRDQW